MTPGVCWVEMRGERGFNDLPGVTVRHTLVDEYASPTPVTAPDSIPLSEQTRNGVTNRVTE